MVRKSKTLPVEALRQAAECLRVLAHPHRLQILQLLLSDTFTVGDLAERCEIANAVCSEHLRTMERCGFLASRREGRHIYYSVIESHIAEILKCVENRFG